ncbi:MAG: o-succinylbenzoate--CoA ligase [Ignavibacteriaceae bacterium]
MDIIGLLSNPKGICNINENISAIITPRTEITYRQLYEKIYFTVQWLHSIGLKSGDKAAILSENSLEYVILILSLWKAGAIPVPLNIRLLPDELKELISFAGCNFVFTDNPEHGLKSIPGISVNKFPLHEKITGKYLITNFEFSDCHDNNELENTALIIFTSGSTGKPRGVELTFNNLLNSAFNGNKLFNNQENDRWLASLPFYHIGGFSIILRNFFFGTALIIPKTLTTEDIIYSIENLNPTLASFVTTQLKRLIETGFEPNQSLRNILLGGGFLETKLVSEALKKGWNVVKSYGTTETASFVTALTAEEFKINPSSAGKAIFPNQILIIDENRNILPDMKVGEIAIKAQSVARGYLNNNDENKKKFAKDIFYSGDYGYLDADGFLYVEARREDLIISGGENIIPHEIEAAIIKYPGIKEVCVFGKEDKEWGHIVIAVIASNEKIEFESLKEFLNDKLPSYKHPKKIHFIDELPKTELGKIRKGKIIEMFNK